MNSDAFEASGEYIKQADEDEELRYGEFDMGFFVAVVEACEPLLEGDGGGDPGAFVDVGSGRGQIPVLAAALRPWSRCTGLEYMPVLHAIAEQAPGLRDEFARAMDESRKQSLRNALGPSFDSPAPLILIACACDAFHAAKNVIFISGDARVNFVKARARICLSKFGSTFWGKLRTKFPLTLPPPRKRLSRKGRPRPYRETGAPRCAKKAPGNYVTCLLFFI